LDEIVNMAQIIHNHSGKRSYRDYIFAINKYLIPFFDEHRASHKTQDLFAFFKSWLISQLGLESIATPSLSAPMLMFS